MTGDMIGAAGTAAGDIATGGLIAHAVGGPGGAHGEGAGGLCLNCGTRREGAFCHHCGQSGHVHRTMGAIGHDIAHGVLHLEGKTWRTLPMLAFRPGELTRRYVHGERMRFVSPLAGFLFSVFLMFAVIGSLPGWNFDNADLLDPGVAAGMAQARTKLAEEKARAGKDLQAQSAALLDERQDAEPDPARITRLERRVGDARKAYADLAQAERMLPVPTTFDVKGAPPVTEQSTNANWLDAKWRHAKENPKLLLYKLKTSAYKYSWALIPISLPFLWLLFPLRRDVGLYDHAIFATYSLTFMSLLVVLLAVLAAIGVPAWLCWTAALIVPPLHLYKQLKGAYRLGRGGALWRLAWLLLFSSFTLTLFATGLLWLGLAD